LNNNKLIQKLICAFCWFILFFIIENARSKKQKNLKSGIWGWVEGREYWLRLRKDGNHLSALVYKPQINLWFDKKLKNVLTTLTVTFSKQNQLLSVR